MNEVIQYLNLNPGIGILIAGAAAIVAAIGLFIKNREKKDTINKDSPHVTVGRDNVAGGDIIAGDKKTINIHQDKEEGLQKFREYVSNAKWKKEFINNQEIWISEKNNLYQIEVGEKEKDFVEEWTKVYPDKLGSGLYNVNLKINGVPIKEMPFVYCDGGRISVPMPEVRIKDDKRIFYWNKNSLEFKIGELIGSFYIYENMEGVAKMSKIGIL